MRKKPQSYFQKDCFQMPEFAQWLHGLKDDNTSAGCKICQKNIKLNHGRVSINRVEKGYNFFLRSD